MDKQEWLDIAEVIDAYRVVPKLILVLLFSGYVWFAVDTYEWIRSIYETKGTIPGTVTAYAAGTLSALGGVLGLVIGKYFDGGRKWVKNS